MPEPRPPAPGPAHPGMSERFDSRMVGSGPPAGRDPRAGVPMPPGRNGSAGHQSLRPLPADDRARPPSAAGTGDRPFLPPAAQAQVGQAQVGQAQAGRVEHGFEQPAQRPPSAVDEDSEPTTPLPVILPGAASVPRPVQVETPRGPFEPARPTRSTSITGSMEPPSPHLNGGSQSAGSLQSGPPGELDRSAAGPGSPPKDDLAQPVGDPLGRPIPNAASEKLEQIKDLYLTAEAIGEDALDKHFDQVSRRQHDLIQEFFERSRPPTGDAP
jgi:hypothetical protein